MQNTAVTKTKDLSQIRCLTFDWGDTLAQNFGVPYRTSLHEALIQYTKDLNAQNIEIPENWIAQTHHSIAEHWNSSGSAADHSEIQALKYLESACQEIGTSISKHPRALDTFFEHYIDTLHPYADVLATLAVLKNHGYRIGILSHVPWPADHCIAWFKRRGLDNFIDFYSLSSAIGWIKPHAAHFEDAIAQANCSSEEIFHIGDHPTRDIEGGRAHGLMTCLRMTEGQHPQDHIDQCEPDYRIRHVKELTGLLPI